MQIDARRQAEEEVRTLSGLLPICAACKKIREDEEWVPVEQYVVTHTEAEFTHGLCPDCLEDYYPDDDGADGRAKKVE